MNVVIVESPAKAKTINKYLGKDYQVFASFGHVRDLPSKNGSVRPEEDFAMDYEVDSDSKKHLTEIGKAVKNASALFLATDPDREGEAISWHVLEALKESKKLPKGIQVQRVTFDEITKNAVTKAFESPRQIDMDMVNAQQARRALDYLVGFTLSPVLWRKLPGSKSAGRVQSVALRLICEREEEIEKFESREYWDIKAQMAADKGEFTARLTEYEGEKLEKFSIVTEKHATSIVEALKAKDYSVHSIEEKQARRHPAPPFTTSTMQQEAARKCGFGAKRTMQVAQKLYEAGHITYMRTDGVNVSKEAMAATRSHIGSNFGDKYVPEKPRFYKSKAKNAQEAHEAIRPTDLSLTPGKGKLDADGVRLYELIWKRMVASQMESAVFDQVVADITAKDGKATLRATGSVMRFDGFLKLYQEGRDDEEEEGENRLPPLKEGQALQAKEITPEQHFTQPPPRYSEASLVKKLEELGIGRPSTYAAIISVLQDRGYVLLDKKRFTPEALGRLVNAFLVSFFTRYVEYDFTADLENKLDDISAGDRDWKEVLQEFWKDFIAKIEESQELTITDVLAALEELLGTYAFGPKEEGKDRRLCPACNKGTLNLRLGRYGPYISCSEYPDCNYKGQLGQAPDSEEAIAAAQYPKDLGADPETGEIISLRQGPYGFYVQLGEEKKPKRASLLKHMNPEDITLDVALQLLALPRVLGKHPDTGKDIEVNNGRYGPYIKHDAVFTSLPPEEDLLTIGINRAVEVLANAPKKGAARAKATPLKVLGKHPDDEGDVAVYEGRYGPYVKHGKINATIPKSSSPETITLEEALKLIADRAAKGGKKKPAKKKAAPKKKTATKKAPAKKKATPKKKA